MAHIVEPPLQQILEYCAEDPVERVFLEDVARRGLGRFSGIEERGRLVALCHSGANVVPSGDGCGAFAAVAVRARARMLIGEQRAVTELWEAAQTKLPAAREDRPGQPVYAISEAPSRAGAGYGRPSSPISSCSSPPARSPTRASSGSTRSGATRTASAGARAPRSRRAARGSGRRTASSSSRRRRRPGRRRRCSCSRCGPIRRRAARGTRAAGLRDLIRLLLERVPTVCLFVRADNEPAIGLYDSVGMSHVLDYRSVLL